eukprot:4807249-Pleurochrysis_carterae.AAC.1
MRALLLSGTLSAPSPADTLEPNATAGSPTTTFAGAARRPSSARPCTASCACTCALVGGGAGLPPPACVCMGSISTPNITSAGGTTSSSSAAPVKSSMYTWRYRGANCAAPPGISPTIWRSARRAAQRFTAGG